MSEVSVQVEAVGVSSACVTLDDDVASLVSFIDACRELVYSVRDGPLHGATRRKRTQHEWSALRPDDSRPPGSDRAAA